MTVETIRLKVIGPDGSVEELTLDSQDSMILGSGASANVRLEDPKVSSIHAMIKAEDGTVRAIDLGSESGTRVGGKEIREQDLETGDVVELGGYKVQVVWGAGGELADAQSTEVVQRPAELDDEPEASVESEPSKKQKKSKGGAPAASAQAAVAAESAPEDMPVSTLFSEVIAEEDRPTSENRLLEIVMVWSDTVIGIGHFQPKVPIVTLGDGSRNDFHLASDLIPSSRFPLVKASGSDQIVTIAEGMTLQVRDDEGKVVDLKQLHDVGRAFRADADFKGYSYKIGLHEQIQINIGDTALILRYVRPSKRIVTGVFKQIDYYFTKVFSTSLMAHLLFMMALLLTPVNLERLSDDLFTNPNRFAKLIIQAPEEEERVFDDLSSIDEGLKAKEDEGKFGEIEEVEEKAAPSEEGAPIVDVDQREEDRKKVMETGLLAALEDGAASNVFGPGGLGTGINEALGGIDGDGMGDAWGLGGLGSRGAGAGGGGSALGIGGLGTKGGGKGRGGHGQVDLGGRGRAVTKVTSGQTIIEGGLDREVIARIVRRHQNEIRFCYERELQRDPNLHGRVAVQWIIDGTGAVARATVQDTTMGNSNVENCILTRIRRWRFPEPRGGGIVRVTYPWIFSPRG